MCIFRNWEFWFVDNLRMMYQNHALLPIHRVLRGMIHPSELDGTGIGREAESGVGRVHPVGVGASSSACCVLRDRISPGYRSAPGGKASKRGLPVPGLEVEPWPVSLEQSHGAATAQD